MRVLVCGGRDYEDYAYLKTVLTALQMTHEPFTTIIHGAYRGADALASTYAHRHQIPELPFKAEWKKLGKSAGPIRNQRMLDEGKPDLVVAFAGGDGTAGMIRIAREAGVEVFDARPVNQQEAAGYAVVPKEATDAICVAYYANLQPPGAEEPRDVWRAMVAAASR